eukprot:2012873-Prymnesium_polylepis.1
MLGQVPLWIQRVTHTVITSCHVIWSRVNPGSPCVSARLADCWHPGFRPGRAAQPDPFYSHHGSLFSGDGVWAPGSRPGPAKRLHTKCSKCCVGSSDVLDFVVCSFTNTVTRVSYVLHGVCFRLPPSARARRRLVL